MAAGADLNAADGQGRTAAHGAALWGMTGVIKFLHENKLDIIRTARRACGSDVPLMVDCSCPWTVDEAIAAARRLADQDLAWLEEPIYPPDDHAGLARLRTAAPMAS